MLATFLNKPFDVTVDDTDEPTIEAPTDVLLRVDATCICGSDLWHYRGVNEHPGRPRRIGHEFCGTVIATGAAVRTVREGQFVVGGFTTSDNTCPHCRAGVHTACENIGWHLGCQAEIIRISNADGTLIATEDRPDDDLVPSLLSCSDVLATGWHAAVSAEVRPGSTVAVVGDGAVGLCGVLAAAQLGAERVIAMSRHRPRQELARAFGATDIVEARGEEGIAEIEELTAGVGADAVLECVGTGESMLQALGCARPGAMVGYVGIPHGVELPVSQMFSTNVGVRGGMAPVRRYLEDLMGRVMRREMDPGRVFDLELPLTEAAAGYRAMDERTAIKVLLRG